METRRRRMTARTNPRDLPCCCGPRGSRTDTERGVSLAVLEMAGSSMVPALASRARSLEIRLGRSVELDARFKEEVQPVMYRASCLVSPGSTARSSLGTCTPCPHLGTTCMVGRWPARPSPGSVVRSVYSLPGSLFGTTPLLLLLHSIRIDRASVGQIRDGCIDFRCVCQKARESMACRKWLHRSFAKYHGHERIKRHPPEVRLRGIDK